MPLGLNPKCPLKKLDGGHELNRRSTTNVEHPERRSAARAVGKLGVPRGVGGRNGIRDAQRAVDDIVDEREVAAVVTVVEHIDGFTDAHFLANKMGGISGRPHGP